MERRLTPNLVADVVVYSRPMAVAEAGTLARQKAHRKELIDPKIAEYGGRVVKSTGDRALGFWKALCEISWDYGYSFAWCRSPSWVCNTRNLPNPGQRPLPRLFDIEPDIPETIEVRPLPLSWR